MNAPGASTERDPPRGGSILVVEDDPDLLALMEIILEGEGYRVRTARDGREALARVKESMPSLVFLDMRMPGMNGWEFASEFRARHGAGCPIVVVTAAEDARRRAEEIAAQGWLAKPFEIADVLAAAAKYAGRAAARAR